MNFEFLFNKHHLAKILLYFIIYLFWYQNFGIACCRAHSTCCIYRIANQWELRLMVANYPCDYLPAMDPNL